VLGQTPPRSVRHAARESPLALTGRLESTDIPNGEGGESNDKKQFTPWDKHFWGRLKLPDETTDVLGRPLEQQASLQRAGPGAGILGSLSAVHKVEGEASLRIKLASGLTPDGGIKSKGCFSGKSVSIERLRLSQAL
jgi:hypothetical protein